MNSNYFSDSIIKKAGFASFKAQKMMTYIYYTNQNFEVISLETLSQGRFLNTFDIKFEQAVCVIDQNIKNTLFKSTNAIGKEIKINNETFKIIGIMEEKNVL